MAQFNISGNNFYDNASLFGQYNEYHFNWDELEREADALKAKTAGDAVLSPAVAELQAAVARRDKGGVVQAVRQYAAAFSSAAFANLASAGVLALVHQFLT